MSKPVARNFYWGVLLDKMWTFLAPFYKVVDLLNEIEDIFSKIMAFKQNSAWIFLTNLWTFYLERGFFST